MQQLKIAFIGAGNMAEAMASGLVRAGHPAANLTMTDTRADRLQALQAQYAIGVETDNKEAVSVADVVVLAVKPQQMQAVVSELSPVLDASKTVVSIAAGVSLASLKKFANGNSLSLIRAMPNTPALVGAGMSVLFSETSEHHRQQAEYVLGASGETAWVAQEAQLHAVTAVSGSGPAYFFLLAEIMQASAMAMGLPEELAARLAAQTAKGAGLMLSETGRTPAELRNQVTSPGGTTQAALDKRYEKGRPEAVRRGSAAAAKRSKELS